MTTEKLPFRLKSLEATFANGRFGFYPPELEALQARIKAFPAIERAWLFGSRSMGTYAEGADVDLALQGGQVNRQTLLRLKDSLEEAFFPLSFDLLHYDTLHHKGLLQHIDHWGIDLLSLSVADGSSVSYEEKGKG